MVTEKAITRELMGKIVDEVFDGAIEDASVIEEIYACIKRHEAALSTDAEPVAYYYISRNGVWHFIEAHEFGGETYFIPLYVAPPAPPVSVMDLDFDAVYVIPREMTDEEWWEVKYNVDRKANPDIDLWRIKDAVSYANFIAGHRGRSALSAQVQDVAGWQDISTAPRDGTKILMRGGAYHGVPFPGYWSPSSFAPDRPWVSVVNDSRLYEHVPTNWMSLPAAPAAKQEGVDRSKLRPIFDDAEGRN